MPNNKTTLMQHRLEAAREKLESAKLLLDNGNLKDSIGRSYYAMFISVRALLAKDGVDFSKHAGVIDMLPQCQHQGFGTQLINTLMDKLREDGYNHLSVCCTTRKAASYALCMKLGFREIYDYGNDCVSISTNL